MHEPPVVVTRVPRTPCHMQFQRGGASKEGPLRFHEATAKGFWVPAADRARELVRMLTRNEKRR